MEWQHGMIARERRRGQWFLVAVLLALASALVPALFASGMPASRATGSAFDPTTSAVALRGRTQLVVRSAILVEKEPAPATATPLIAPLPIGPSTQPPGFTLAGPLVGAFVAPRRTVSSITRARPRAPPVAIA